MVELTETEVRMLLRGACRRAGSQDAWARQAGLSPQHVSDVLLGRRGPAGQVLRALGLARRVRYVQTAAGDPSATAGSPEPGARSTSAPA